MINPDQLQKQYYLKSWHMRAVADPAIAALVDAVEAATDDPVQQVAILEAAQEAFNAAPRPFDMSPKIGRIIPRRPQPFVRVNNPLLPGNRFKFMLPTGLYRPLDRLAQAMHRIKKGGE